MAEKAYSVMDKIATISPEEISKLQEVGTELIKKLNEAPVLQNSSVVKKIGRGKGSKVQ